jgi:predicted nucleic-acid-binding Zn-ribbon protein
MPLSQKQGKALSDYLSQNPLTCEKCGATDWEYGDIQLGAAAVYVEPRKVEPSTPFVELTCRSCGHVAAVNCDDAGIPEV